MNILKVLTQKRILGNFGECAAVKFLKRNGYRILDKNFVANGNEIDIVAMSRECVAFIEVKTRTVPNPLAYEPRPASSVTPEKQRAIISAAKRHPAFYLERPKRFDVIEVYTEKVKGKPTVKEIKHLLGSFNYNTAHKRR